MNAGRHVYGHMSARYSRVPPFLLSVPSMIRVKGVFVILSPSVIRSARYSRRCFFLSTLGSCYRSKTDNIFFCKKQTIDDKLHTSFAGRLPKLYKHGLVFLHFYYRSLCPCYSVNPAPHGMDGTSYTPLPNNQILKKTM